MGRVPICGSEASQAISNLGAYCMTVEAKIIACITDNLLNQEYIFDADDWNDFCWHDLMRLANEQKVYNHVLVKVQHQMPPELRKKCIIIQMAAKFYAKKALKQAAQLSGVFDNKGLEYVIVKGFVLSHLLYGDYHTRQFGDIDYIAHEDSIVQMCLETVNFGYRNKLLSQVAAGGIHVPEFEKNLYYLSSSEKAFVCENKVMVEIKKEKYKYRALEASKAIKRRAMVEIERVNFHTYNPSDMFVYVIDNAFFNFFSEYGVYNDYVVGDLLDFYVFVVKNKEIFAPEYLKEIDRKGHINRLALLMDMVKEYFSEAALKQVPEILLGLASIPESSFYIDFTWKSGLNDRILDKKRRIEEYESIMYSHCTNIKFADALVPNDVRRHPFDVNKGLVDTDHAMLISLGTNLLIPSMVYFGAGYDTDKFYMYLKIPKEFPDVDVVFIFPINDFDKSNGYFTEITIKYGAGKVWDVESDIDAIDVFINIFDKHYILILFCH